MIFIFYELLTSLCEKRGTNITNVLKELNMSTSKGTAWKGGAYPKGENLAKLAEYFNVSADYLLGRTDDPTPHLTMPDEIKGALVAFNRGEFEDLTQGEIDALANIAKTFKTQREGSTNEMARFINI